MKPTLQEILDFGTEKVDKDFIKFTNGREFIQVVPVKRYRMGVIYKVCNLYGYSNIAISKARGLSKTAIGRAIGFLKNSENFEEDANELKNSLDYIYKYSIFDQKKENLISLYKQEKSKLSFEDWLIVQL